MMRIGPISHPTLVALLTLCVAFFLCEPSLAGTDIWTPMNGPYGGIVKFLALAPNGLEIYAAILDKGIFKSSNSASSWTVFNNGLNNLSVASIAINPASSATVYAATADGVYKITSPSGSWFQRNSGLANLFARSIAINPISTAMIFVATADGVYKSTNSADAWAQVNNGLPAVPDVQALAIGVSQSSAVIYAGTNGNGIYKSSDLGNSWSQVNSGLASLRIRSLSIASNGTTSYAVADDGVYRSLNSGQTWVKTGLSGQNLQSVMISLSDGSVVYVASDGSGAFRSSDFGANWTQIKSGLNSLSTWTLAGVSAATIYLGSSTGVYKSANSGSSWFSSNIGINGYSLQAVALSRDAKRIFAGAENGFFTTSDSGVNWSASILPGSGKVVGMITDLQNPSLLYAATTEAGVFKSSNLGGSFSDASSGLNTSNIQALAADLKTSSTLYAVSATSSIFKSGNSATSWVHIHTPLGFNIRSISAAPDGKTLYVGADEGVYKSEDSGLTWTRVSLETVKVHAIVVNPVYPNILYAATESLGVQKSVNSGISWASLNSGLSNNLKVKSLAIDPQLPNILYAVSDLIYSYSDTFISLDGLGKVELSPSNLIAGKMGNTIEIAFTSEVMINGGAIQITLPSDWSQPKGIPNQNGYTTATSAGQIGSPSFFNQSLTLPVVSLLAGEKISVIYGSGGGKSGFKTPEFAAEATISVMSKASSIGDFKAVQTQPKANLTYALDGSGKMTLISEPSVIIAGSEGNQLTFTYTSEGLMREAKVSVTMPNGWTPPQSTIGNPGYVAISSTGSISQPTFSDNGLIIPVTKISDGENIVIIYGFGGKNSGVKAPDTLGASTFTVKSQSSSSGNLKDLQSLPTLTVAAVPDGSGTITVSTQPSTTHSGSANNQVAFSYKPVGTIISGELQFTFPDLWSLPQPSSTEPGYSYVSLAEGVIGAIKFSNRTLTIPIIRLSDNQALNLQYGSLGVSATKAPKTPGVYTFRVAVKGSQSGVLKEISSQPTITVIQAADGSGKINVTNSPASVFAGSIGNEMTFVYKAEGQMDGGSISVAFPASWSVPQPIPNIPGYTVITSDGVIGNPEFLTSTSTVRVAITKLRADEVITITYGKGGGASGGKAPLSSGVSTFVFKSKGSLDGSLTQTWPAVSAPIIPLPDGFGEAKIGTTPAKIASGSLGNELRFTYTAAGTMDGGAISLTLPSGWTPPQGSFGKEGYTTVASQGQTGSPAFSERSITIPIIRLSGGETITIVYGSGGGTSGSMAQTSSGQTVFEIKSRSSPDGSFIPLKASPSLEVGSAQDGSGTMVIKSTNPSVVNSGTEFMDLSLLYTATGEIKDGKLSIEIPSDWGAPQDDPSKPAYVKSVFLSSGESGNPVFSGQTVLLSIKSLSPSAQIEVEYFRLKVPKKSGFYTITAKSQGGGSGALGALSKLPLLSITNAKDGSGSVSLSAQPAVVKAASFDNQLSFTFKADGSMDGGAISITIPEGWSPPQGSAGVQGYTTAATTDSSSRIGSLLFSGQVITVPIINLSGGERISVIYGAGSGKSAAVAPGASGRYIFEVRSRASPSGGLVPLKESLSLEVGIASDGSGSLLIKTIKPSVINSGVEPVEISLLYKAAGEMKNGKLSVQMPIEWGLPQGDPSKPNYVKVATTGLMNETVFEGSSIIIPIVSLSLSDIVQIDLINFKAPNRSGKFDIISKSQASLEGKLEILSQLPSATVVNAKDGSGKVELSATPDHIKAGSSGNQLIFVFTAQGMMDGGTLSISIQEGWSSPQSKPSIPGYVFVVSPRGKTGSLSFSGQTIIVPIINLSGGDTISAIYGSGGGASGAKAQASDGLARFIVKSAGSSSGQLTEISSSPQINILSNPGSISGKVSKADGVGISGALVELIQLGKVVVSAISSSEGRYRIDNIPSGKYQLKSTAAKFIEGLKENISVESGSDIRDVDITLTRKKLTAPLNLKVEADIRGVKVGWQPLKAPEDLEVSGYNVYRSLEGNAYQKIASGVSNAAYLDVNVVSSLLYSYKVSGVDSSQLEGDLSEAVIISYNKPDFTISVKGDVQTVKIGEKTSYSVSLESKNGFSESVKLSVIDLPKVFDRKLNPETLSPSGIGSVSRLEVAAGGLVLEGAYKFKVRASVDKDIFRDVDLQIVVEKASSEVSLIPNPKKVNLGREVEVLGQILLKEGEVATEIELSLTYIFDGVERAKSKAAASGFGWEYRDKFKPDRIGVWKVIARWQGDKKYRASERSAEFEVVKLPPKAVIVLGGGDEKWNPAWERFNSLALYVYKVFKMRGLSDDDIFFLSPNPAKSPKADDISSERTLEFAIAKWAASQISPQTPIFIYLLSHNLSGDFILEKRSDFEVRLSPVRLKELLDQLPADAPTTLIVESTNSGRFIPAVSKPGLTVIASAAADKQTVITPNLSSFSREFFNRIVKNLDIKTAFLEASESLLSIKPHSSQSPQLEANGDKIANDPSRDFGLVSKAFIPEDVPSSSYTLPIVAEVSPPLQLPKGKKSSTFRVKVLSASEVVAMVFPPRFDPARNFTSWEAIDFDKIKFSSKGEGIFEGEFGRFTQPGSYSIAVYAENDNGGATPLSTTVRVVSPPWDVNGDGQVDNFDLIEVVKSVGLPVSDYDVNEDGIVNVFDVVLVAIHFGEKYTP